MSEGSVGNRNMYLIAALILAIGIVVGGYLLGDGLRRARMAERAVTVRGLSERNVTADLATWTVSFTAQGTALAAVQAESDRDAVAVQQFFRAAGFPADAVSDAGGSVSQYYDSNRGETNVTVNRRIALRTTDVMRARAAYARQFNLIETVAVFLCQLLLGNEKAREVTVEVEKPGIMRFAETVSAIYSLRRE